MATKTFEYKDNTGSLFQNENKVKETQPDLTGKIKITDVSESSFYRISGWENDGGRIGLVVETEETFQQRVAESKAGGAKAAPATSGAGGRSYSGGRSSRRA